MFEDFMTLCFKVVTVIKKEKKSTTQVINFIGFNKMVSFNYMIVAKITRRRKKAFVKSKKTKNLNFIT